MWNKYKSFKLTQAVIRVCYVLLFAVSVSLPFLLNDGFYRFDILPSIKQYILLPFYAVVPAGYVALICFDKLLINVKRENVFVRQNINLLRIISFACFYAGCVGLISFIVILIGGFMFETMLVLSVGEYFMWLVVRVVKNLFETATEIKEENDLTI